MATTTVAINLEAKTSGTESVKSLKTQIREATQEAVALAQKFGEFSPEATKAAQNVAKLKDQMGDFQQRVAALNPDKFAAIGTVVKGMTGGIQAAQGAMALFGSESEDVQKALLKVQGAMAFAQGMDQLMAMKNSFGAMAQLIKTNVIAAFTTLKGAIIATGIGALAILIGVVVNNFEAISDWIMSSPLGSLIRAVGDLVQQFTDFVGITSEAERQLDKLSAANERANEDMENRIKVLTAQGGKEKDIYAMRVKQANNELQTLRETLKVKGKLSEDEAKQFREAKTKLLVLSAEYDKKLKDDTKKAAEDAQKTAEENYKKAVEIAKQRAENERNTLLSLNEEKRKALETAAKNETELAAVKYTNDLERIKEAKANELRQENLTATAKENINKKYQLQETAAKVTYDKSLLDIDKKQAEEAKKVAADLAAWKKGKDEEELTGLNDFYKKKQLVLIQNNATPEQLSALELQRMEEEKRLRLEQGQSIVDIELQIAAKKKEVYDKDVEAKKKAEEDKRKAEQDTLKLTADGFAAIGELATTFAGKSEEQQRKAFEIKKAASIAQAIVETYMAAQSAYASQIIPMDPTSVIRGTIAAGLALAAGLSRVAAIKKTKFESKEVAGGGGGGGSIGDVGPAPSFTPTAGGSLPDEGQFGGMGRVYVLEGDITKTQTRVRRLRNTSVV